MKKKVLIICRGNSCRSIIAEALINKYLDGVEAYSCGTSPSYRVNPYAKRVLKENLAWKDRYYSKDCSMVTDIDFDLVVTVCDSTKERCPIFSKNVKRVHIGFSDPDGEEYLSFQKIYLAIKEKLIPNVKSLCGIIE